MAKANKQFTYLVSYYTRETVEDLSSTRRESETMLIEAGSATRALAKFKREDAYQGALIVSITPDGEGRYDVGPVTVDLDWAE